MRDPVRESPTASSEMSFSERVQVHAACLQECVHKRLNGGACHKNCKKQKTTVTNYCLVGCNSRCLSGDSTLQGAGNRWAQWQWPPSGNRWAQWQRRFPCISLAAARVESSHAALAGAREQAHLTRRGPRGGGTARGGATASDPARRDAASPCNRATSAASAALGSSASLRISASSTTL